jgi:hypothetical protein
MADKMVTNSCKSNRKDAELKYYFLNVCRYFNLVISVENKISPLKRVKLNILTTSRQASD